MGHLQKEGLRPNPETPKTIFGPQLRLQASHQNCGVGKIKDLQGPIPNKEHTSFDHNF